MLGLPIVFILGASFVLATIASALSRRRSDGGIVPDFSIYAAAAAFGCLGGAFIHSKGLPWPSAAETAGGHIYIIAVGAFFTGLVAVLRRVWGGRRPG